jgi:hypothetical protein
MRMRCVLRILGVDLEKPVSQVHVWGKIAASSKHAQKSQIRMC